MLILEQEMLDNSLADIADIAAAREASANKLSEALAEIAKDTAKEEVKAAEEVAEKKKKMDEDELKRKKEIQDAAIESLSTIVNAGFEINKNNREAETQDELSRLETIKNKQLENINLTEAGKKIIQDKYDAQRRAILTKQWEADKRAAITSAVIQGALAVIKALASGGPPLAIATGIIVGAEIAVMSQQKPPKFHEGEIDIYGKKKNSKGEFAATLIEHESVIAPEPTKRYKKELEAINAMKFEDLVYTKYLLPALQEQKKQFEKEKNDGFAGNIARSLVVNAKLNDGNLIEMLKRVNSTSKQNAEFLAKTLKTKRKYYRGNA